MVFKILIAILLVTDFVLMGITAFNLGVLKTKRSFYTKALEYLEKDREIWKELVTKDITKMDEVERIAYFEQTRKLQGRLEAIGDFANSL